MYCSSPDCKDMMKKYNELDSRARHLQYAAEDYDRQKGKGAFKKKFTEESKLLETLIEQKIKMTAQHAKNAHKNMNEQKDSLITTSDSPVPVY